jgi:hypothetical protein
MENRTFDLPLGGLLCWLGSLLGMLPFIGIFILPGALVGSLVVWKAQGSVVPKVVGGLLPLLIPVLYYSQLLSRK